MVSCIHKSKNFERKIQFYKKGGIKSYTVTYTDVHTLFLIKDNFIYYHKCKCMTKYVFFILRFLFTRP